jgi:N-hydroxyarylamine O-acetyltransferase
MIDVARYLERIGYQGATAATLETLVGLHECHAGAIPFENLDVLAGRAISVEPADVEAKLVGRGRGGYCYEQATLFQSVLEALGFTTRARLARVRWADQRPTPLGHLVLVVDTAEGPYLADVGFGGRGLLHPLPLVAGRVLHSPDGARYRFTPEGEGGLFLEGDVGSGWDPHYVFYPTPTNRKDIEMANYYTSTFPLSMFRRLLLVQRLTRRRRAVLVNRTLTVRAQGVVTMTELADDAALALALRSEFGIIIGPDLELPRLVPAAPPPGPDPR